MSAGRPVPVPSDESELERRQQELRTILRDLEGVNQLQQMEARLLREVLQALRRLGCT